MPKQKKKLECMVFYHDVNKDEIRPLNIFSHRGFAEDIEKNLKRCSTKEEFSKELSQDLSYYFRAKAEYEVVVSPWCGTNKTKDIKVDIYSQVNLNWDVFVNYVWRNKNTK